MLIIILLLGSYADLARYRRSPIRGAIFFSMCSRCVRHFNRLSMIITKYRVCSRGLIVVFSSLTITGFLYFFLGWRLKWISSVFVAWEYRLDVSIFDLWGKLEFLKEHVFWIREEDEFAMRRWPSRRKWTQFTIVSSAET